MKSGYINSSNTWIHNVDIILVNYVNIILESSFSIEVNSHKTCSFLSVCVNNIRSQIQTIKCAPQN